MINIIIFLSDAITVTLQPCSTPVTEGDNVTLYCNATGIPVPNNTWIRESTGNVLSNKQAYIITAIKRNESGSYKCVAWNSIGNNNTKSCTIDVQCKDILIHVGLVTGSNTLKKISNTCERF